MYVPVASFGTVVLSEQPDPFHVKEAAGVSYRVANDKFRGNFKGALVGWKVRETALSGFGHEDAPDIEKERTETALMTPYNESTGPRDAGDGFRWVEHRLLAGRGIIIVPPDGWKPEDDVMRQTTGEITVIATEDFQQVKKHATSDKPGFVLAEPAQGWKNVDTAPTVPLPGLEDASTKTLLIAAGIVVGAVGVGYLVWGR